MGTGKRQHKPFTITKEVDKSSPILYSILVTNENLPTVTLQFMRANTAGAVGLAGAGDAEKPYYTVTLTNAHISQIRFVQPDTLKTETRSLPEIEEVSFTYQKIVWTFAEGGITAQDDWTM
jgi:type VI secretion system secreted protein Hcp